MYETAAYVGTTAVSASNPSSGSHFQCATWDGAVYPANIRSGFRAAGIYPLNRSTKFIEGTSTPAERGAVPDTPATPAAPTSDPLAQRLPR